MRRHRIGDGGPENDTVHLFQLAQNNQETNAWYEVPPSIGLTTYNMCVTHAEEQRAQGKTKSYSVRWWTHDHLGNLILKKGYP